MTTKKKAIQFSADPDVAEYLNSLDSRIRSKIINEALRDYKTSSSPTKSPRRLIPEVNHFLDKRPDATAILEKRIEALETAMKEVQAQLNTTDEAG